jgi:SecY
VNVRFQAVRLGATTLAALLAYRIGSFIPLPGLNLSGTVADLGGNSERFSINALGVVPWFLALTLVELAALLLPKTLSATFARAGHARPFSAPVVCLALALALMQSIGISKALTQVPRLVTEPSDFFILTTVITLTIGTAVVMALAQLIERHGVGYGFWIMLATWSISSIAPAVAQLYEMHSQGVVSLPIVGFAIAGDVVIIGAVVVLLHARRSAGLSSGEPLIWPIVLAPLIASWSIGFAAFAGSDVFEQAAHHWIVPNNPIGVALHAVITSLVVVRYAFLEGSRVFILPSVALAVAGTIVSQIIVMKFGVQPLLGGVSAIIVTTVAFAVLDRFERLGSRGLIAEPSPKR